MTSTPKPEPRLKGLGISAGVGVLSAGVALGVAELVAGLVGVRSPVIAVGDRAILLVPPAVKDIAIELFGTKDKIALLAGIVGTIALLAVLIGFAARRSFRVAAAGVLLICGIGLLAGLASTDPVLKSIAPAAVGGLIGVLTIDRFRRSPGVAIVPASGPKDAQYATLDRRRFLKVTAGVGAIAATATVAGRFLASKVSAAASRAAVVLPAPLQRLAPIPAAAQVEGVTPFITPNKDFYRIDTALQVPQVDTANWNLLIKGMVEKELSFTFDELLNRKDVIETDVTMTCVSNTRGGELIGNARWLGIPVKNLLDEAGVDPARATQLIGRSIDRYTCGFPTAAVYDGRTCIVAIGMNGEPLPTEHGFPARLVTAGLYGYVSATKWLTEIEMNTMEGFDSYWVPRGYAKQAPIKTQARIDAPKSLAKIAPGTTQIAGVAWSQPRGISKVEVQVDSGPWILARLAEEVSKSTWRQWVADWKAEPGLHLITVRATDTSGEVQTERKSEPLPDGTSGRHAISVTVDA